MAWNILFQRKKLNTMNLNMPIILCIQNLNFSDYEINLYDMIISEFAHAHKHLSNVLPVHNGVKQGHASSPCILILGLDYVTSKGWNLMT
jgi:hypothetical protein